MKLVDALVESLILWDVRYVFGVSGANIEHLHDAIHRLGNNQLISIMAKCEDGAAFMADCHARVQRTLGVCCSTSGGGMLNLAVGIAEAYAESVPVLAIVGQPPTNLEGAGAFQDSSGIGYTVDAVKMWSAVSKYVAKITRPDDFWRCLEEAVTAALSGRPGPAVLLIPRDLYEKEVTARPEPWPATLAQISQPEMVQPEALRPLLEQLRGAHNPVLIIGQGVRRCSAPEAVRQLARTMQIPVCTTLSGRSEYDHDDPLYLGTVGVAGHPSVHDYLRDRADLLLIIGESLNMMTRGPIKPDIDDKKVAVINIDLSDIERIIAPVFAIEADAGAACRAMLALLEQEPYTAPPLSDYQLSWFEPKLAVPIATPEQQNGRSMLQSEALTVLNDFLPENGNVVFDAGNCAAAGIHFTKLPHGASSTIALGMGGMGYSIAGAIGAQLGSPPGTRTIVCCGDGAFLMLGFEVHTAVDLQLPILFVVFNNNMHGMCVTRQQLWFESRIECARYAAIDIATVARGFGSADYLWTGTASTLDELQHRLKDYHQHLNIPGVLELRLLHEEVPPFTPFLPKNSSSVHNLSGVAETEDGC